MRQHGRAGYVGARARVVSSTAVHLVLASQSPARAALLRAAGIEPIIRVSGVDEDALAASLTDPTPADLVRELAVAKAAAVLPAVATEYPEAVVIGCDSMLLFDGVDGPEVVGKPATVELARERWNQVAGTSGELLTGHAVVRLGGGRVVGSADGIGSTTVRFGTPTETELDAYLATGEPLQVAGGFTLDGFGGWFIEGVDGDPSSVIGLGLPLTRRLLDKVGVRVTDLWTRAN